MKIGLMRSYDTSIDNKVKRSYQFFLINDLLVCNQVSNSNFSYFHFFDPKQIFKFQCFYSNHNFSKIPEFPFLIFRFSDFPRFRNFLFDFPFSKIPEFPFLVFHFPDSDFMVFFDFSSKVFMKVCKELKARKDIKNKSMRLEKTIKIKSVWDPVTDTTYDGSCTFLQFQYFSEIPLIF